MNNAERLGLLLAAQAQSKNDREIDPDLVSSLIWSGDEWALSWVYNCLEKEPHRLDETVDETVTIFDMFRHLQRSETSNVSEIKNTVFDGFDGNNDDHKGVAWVLVEKLGLFDDMVGATANSHSIASLQSYRKMLARYQPMIAKEIAAGTFRPLTSAEIDTVLNG
jgi:hypothetical protein